MLIHVCDKCHEQIEGSVIELTTWSLVVDGMRQHVIEYKEFCSMGCQTKYILDGIRGKGLAGDIKV